MPTTKPVSSPDDQLATIARGKERPQHHGGRRRQGWVPVVEVPPAHNAIDVVINALVAAWNAQPDDLAARVFFGPCLMGERQRLISDSLYRWESERDQQFVAAWLGELARAIQGGTFRWNS